MIDPKDRELYRALLAGIAMHALVAQPDVFMNAGAVARTACLNADALITELEGKKCPKNLP